MEDGAYSDSTTQAVHQLAYTCLEDLGHTNQVTRLALIIYDELQDLHKLSDPERFWLECGAMLHDIGWVHGQKSHHKESLRMILESELLPLDNKEKLIVASIARYHRKALPSLRHDHFAALEPNEREMVSKLAAILRIADGLDYTHNNVISDIRCEVKPKKVVFWCQAGHAAQMEFEHAAGKADLFTQEFDRKVIFVEKKE